MRRMMRAPGRKPERRAPIPNSRRGGAPFNELLPAMASVVPQGLSCAVARAPQGRGDRWSQLDGDHGAAVTVTTPVGREREAIRARWPKEHICVYSRRWDQRGAAAGRQLRRGIRTRLCTGHFGALTNARLAPASPDMLMRRAEARHGVGSARNGLDRL
jgi:hypothetical protein